MLAKYTFDAYKKNPIFQDKDKEKEEPTYKKTQIKIQSTGKIKDEIETLTNELEKIDTIIGQVYENDAEIRRIHNLPNAQFPSIQAKEQTKVPFRTQLENNKKLLLLELSKFRNNLISFIRKIKEYQIKYISPSDYNFLQKAIEEAYQNFENVFGDGTVYEQLVTDRVFRVAGVDTINKFVNGISSLMDDLITELNLITQYQKGSTSENKTNIIQEARGYGIVRANRKQMDPLLLSHGLPTNYINSPRKYQL
jgi:hypothetical protein